MNHLTGDAVMTVCGPVRAAQLGLTLAHEHLLMDGTCLWRAPKDPSREWLVDAEVTPEMHSTLLFDPYHSRDNVMLDDPDDALSDLLTFRRAGGSTVVELSSRQLGPHPQGLRMLAERAGLNVVAGTGFYISASHPEWVGSADVQALTEAMLSDLQAGFGVSGVRAGVIGELGTSSPVHPDEIKVLMAAARAQRATGVGINVHLTLFAHEGEAVLDILESSGANLTRVALSHLDETLDYAYHDRLAERGVFLEFDTFGSECQFTEAGSEESSDDQRLEALTRLAEHGQIGQILLSQDVCTKMQRRRLGGRGYDHLLTDIVPRLRRRGFSEEDLATMLIANPARFLSGARVPVRQLPDTVAPGQRASAKTVRVH